MPLADFDTQARELTLPLRTQVKIKLSTYVAFWSTSSREAKRRSGGHHGGQVRGGRASAR